MPTNATSPPFISGLRAGRCDGFQTSIQGPHTLTGDELPESWRKSGFTTAYHGYWVVECKRVAIETYERGPVSIVLEIHNNANPPDACGHEDRAFLWILRNAYVSDAALAEAFERTLGVPTQAAEITIRDEAESGINHTRVEWTTPRGTSYLTTSYVEDRLGPRLDELLAYVVDENRVNILVWTEEYKFPNFKSYETTGELTDESLHYRAYGSRYAGVASLLLDHTLSVDVVAYDNPTCEADEP